MLSTELRGRTVGEPFVGDPGLENEATVSVGVGGVTRVVGVCNRLGGVAGTEVSRGCGICCFGVSGRDVSCFFAATNPGFEVSSSVSTACEALARRSAELLLLLVGLKNPPRPPVLLPPDFRNSASPDFFRVNVNFSLNLLDGDGLREGNEAAESSPAGSAGSTIAGMLDKG